MQQTLPDVPAWIYPLAAFAAAFVGYLAKLGYDKGKTEKPFPGKATAQVGAVVVDSQALSRLNAAIEAATLERITTRKANDDRETRVLRAIEGECTRVVRATEDLTEEVKQHREELRRLGDRIAARR